MGKERTGRPKHFDWSDPDIDRHGVHIPDGGIHKVHLADAVKQYTLPVGQYGRTQYNRCKYGERYGIYGSDNYDMCKYW